MSIARSITTGVFTIKNGWESLGSMMAPIINRLPSWRIIFLTLYGGVACYMFFRDYRKNYQYNYTNYRYDGILKMHKVNRYFDDQYDTGVITFATTFIGSVLWPATLIIKRYTSLYISR